MTKPKDVSSNLKIEELKSILHYEPDTGNFLWKKTTGSRACIGSIAGSLKPSGYICININNKRYRAHRLAWFYMTGCWPKNQIDHRNLNRSDNRFKNLREANNQSNQINTKISRNNKTGYKGVYRVSRNGEKINLWGAKININKKQIHLGYFNSPDDASIAYLEGARRFFGDFANNDTYGDLK